MLSFKSRRDGFWLSWLCRYETKKDGKKSSSKKHSTNLLGKMMRSGKQVGWATLMGCGNSTGLFMMQDGADIVIDDSVEAVSNVMNQVDHDAYEQRKLLWARCREMDIK